MKKITFISTVIAILHLPSAHALDINYFGTFLDADPTLELIDAKGEHKTYTLDPSVVNQVRYSDSRYGEDLAFDFPYGSPKCATKGNTVSLGSLVKDFTVQLKTPYGITHSVVMKAEAFHRIVTLQSGCVEADGKTLAGLELVVRQPYPAQVTGQVGTVMSAPSSVHVIDFKGIRQEYLISTALVKVTENEKALYLTPDGLVTLCMTPIGYLAADFRVQFKTSTGEIKTVTIAPAIPGKREVQVEAEFDCSSHNGAKVITRLGVWVADGDALIQ